MSFERSQSQVEQQRRERKEKRSKIFEELSLRTRTFFSLTQPRKAKRVGDSIPDSQYELKDEDFNTSKFRIKLTLVDFKCNNCASRGDKPTFTMDSLMHKLKCKTCREDESAHGYI